MPVIFRLKGYVFFFYSNEGDPREPAHIHVRKGTKTCKFWLVPTVSLCENYGIKPKDINWLKEVVKNRKDFIILCWNEFFSS